MDSELMHSIVGSYLKPPERVFVPSFAHNNESSQTYRSANLEVTSPKMLHSPNGQGNSVFLMFIYFERERERVGEGQREKERENPKQAPCCQRRAGTGLYPMTELS